MTAPIPFVLPDLCDVHADRMQIAAPLFRHFGGRQTFHGPLLTIACFEDNSLVADRVREPGGGAVLVVDGGASLRCALVGDNLARLALGNGWAGIVVNACVRDVDELAQMDIGILALGPHPMRSVKRGQGRRDEPVEFAGLRFVPGHFVFADRNGLAVSAADLLAN